MTAAAERQARWRQRVRRGLVVVPVVAPHIELTEALVAAGFLRPHEIDDRKAIARGLTELIAEYLRRVGL
jgi:hypothetical protein